MTNSAVLRVEIEKVLEKRVPAALSPKIRQQPELFSTGISTLDEVIGGIPRGNITEVSGTASAGKTSFALSSVASITREGALCAWVDISDSLSPVSAAVAGVVLRRLLWLRMSERKVMSRLEQALKTTDLLLQAGGFAAIVLDISDIQPHDAMRVPLTTWYRFRLAAEQARTALVLLTQSPCANSCSALVLRCDSPNILQFSRDGETPLYEGQEFTIVRERNRNESPFAKKPSARAEWRTIPLVSGVR